MKPFIEAYKMGIKDKNYMLWLQGNYMISALSSSVGNMFRKKNSKPIEYLKEPLDIFAENRIVITDDMTEEEKKAETMKLFGMLEDMQEKFENSHGGDRA